MCSHCLPRDAVCSVWTLSAYCVHEAFFALEAKTAEPEAGWRGVEVGGGGGGFVHTNTNTNTNTGARPLADRLNRCR